MRESSVFFPSKYHIYVQYNDLAICSRTKRNTNIVTTRALFDSTLFSEHARPQLRRRRGILFNFGALKVFFHYLPNDVNTNAK